jgi:hypothetical protein
LGWQTITPLALAPQVKFAGSVHGLSAHSSTQAPVALPAFLKQRRPGAQSKSYTHTSHKPRQSLHSPVPKSQHWPSSQGSLKAQATHEYVTGKQDLTVGDAA